MEHDALAPTETLAGTEGQINRWLREYMRGGPDRCEECLRRGALPEVVEKARDARRQWNADQAKWLADEVGEGAIDRPETAKVIPAVPNVPGASVVPPSSVASPPMSRRERYQAEWLAAKAAKHAAAERAEAVKQADTPRFCDETQPSVAPNADGPLRASRSWLRRR
jgi:hypothetical protein